MKKIIRFLLPYNHWPISLQLNALRKLKPLLSIAITTLVIAYPFIGYQFMQQGFGSWPSYALAILFLWRAYRANPPKQRLAQLSIAILLIGTTVFIGSATSKAIPLFIFLALAALFGRTLFKPPAIVERVVRFQFDDIPDEVLIYCRKLTIVWTLLFLLISIISASLSYFGNNWWWAMFHGVITYALMAILGLAEYIYRPIRFPFMKDNTPPMRDTFIAAMKNQDQLWK